MEYTSTLIIFSICIKVEVIVKYDCSVNIQLNVPKLFKPIIAPTPIICPKLVVANNSGSPNPFKPKIGIEGPKPLTCIAYLPSPIHNKLQTNIIIAFGIDHEGMYSAKAMKICIFIS